MKFDKKNAMTYIELIMVIAIIGAVAAIAIPSLKRHSQKTEFAALAKKAYMDIEDAMDNAILTEGPMRKWEFTDNKTFCSTYLAPNVSVSKDYCASGNYILTRSLMRMSVDECNGRYCHIHVDVNADQPPNLVGKDYFEFQINKVDNGGYQKAETVQPAAYAGADLLRQNGWQFTDRLWRCDWVNDSANCGL